MAMGERVHIPQVEISWENDYRTVTVDAIQLFYSKLNGRPVAEVIPQAEDAIAAYTHMRIQECLDAGKSG